MRVDVNIVLIVCNSLCACQNNYQCFQSFSIWTPFFAHRKEEKQEQQLLYIFFSREKTHIIEKNSYRFAPFFFFFWFVVAVLNVYSLTNWFMNWFIYKIKSIYSDYTVQNYICTTILYHTEQNRTEQRAYTLYLISDQHPSS